MLESRAIAALVVTVASICPCVRQRTLRWTSIVPIAEDGRPHRRGASA